MQTTVQTGDGVLPRPDGDASAALDATSLAFIRVDRSGRIRDHLNRPLPAGDLRTVLVGPPETPRTHQLAA